MLVADIRLVDTTLRDGVQSLWALSMRPRHAAPVLGHIDRAGFDQVEVMAPGASFKKFVRHLGENPWDHVRAIVTHMDPARLRWHGRFEGYALSGGIPREVGALMIQKVVDMGIRYTRIGDNWNRLSLLRDKKERLEALGMTPVVNIMYSVSARHTDDYFVQRARDAAELRPFRICFKDVGGLLKPDRARALIPKMIAQTGDVPWEFHGHCNNGFGPLNALAAVESGISYIHTAIPPLANGNSQPSVYNVAENLRAMGHDAHVDLAPLPAVTEHLTDVAHREGFPIGRPHEFSEQQYRHQVPGGMISNLEYQLRQAGVEDKLEATLEESARVRAEFGYPIMVTPLSQFVGSQAAINVIVGERYKQVSDDVIHYAWGRHGGDEAIDAMDPEVRAKILDRPRARELEHFEQPEPTLRELRERYGRDTSDEDLIVRAIVGDDALDAIATSEARRLGTRSATDVVRDVLDMRHQHRVFAMKTDGLSLRLERSGASAVDV